MKTPNSKSDAHRWLDGEISLGKFIHNSSLENCYAQASDFAGGIANAYNDKLQTVMQNLEKMRARAQMDYNEANAKNNAIDMTAEAARMRAIQESMSAIHHELGQSL